MGGKSVKTAALAAGGADTGNQSAPSQHWPCLQVYKLAAAVHPCGPGTWEVNQKVLESEASLSSTGNHSLTTAIAESPDFVILLFPTGVTAKRANWDRRCPPW